MSADDSARDDARRDSEGDAAVPDAQPQPPLDEEAAWRLIVENYGDRPSLDTDEATDGDTPRHPDATTGSTATTAIEPDLPGAQEPPGPDRFDRSYLDALDAARSEPVARPPGEPEGRQHDREEHYVPPEPPPVPRPTPARRLAWCGLFLPPLLMLAAVVLDWTFPSWVALGLVAGFVGGFVFLVATMPRDGGDGWGDGAVV